MDLEERHGEAVDGGGRVGDEERVEGCLPALDLLGVELQIGSLNTPDSS